MVKYVVSLFVFLISFIIGTAYGVQSVPAFLSTTGNALVERNIHFQGVVLLEANASDDKVRQAVAAQVKTALGSLQVLHISLNDRDARMNLNADTWVRKSVKVVGSDGLIQNAVAMQQIEYSYNDKAIVGDKLAQINSFSFVLLAGNYWPKLDLLKQNCSNDPNDVTNSLWYHFTPTLPTCEQLINAEIVAIAKEKNAFNNMANVIGINEANRLFLPVTATLGAPVLPGRDFYPEYYRLFGFDSDRTKLVVYVFLGADKNSGSLDDSLGQENMRFYQSLFERIPQLQVTSTQPYSMLLDIYLDGQKLEGLTYKQLLGWLVDKQGFPSGTEASATKQQDLRQQAINKFAERSIIMATPLEIAASDGRHKKLTLEIHTFYGLDDGNSEIREQARNRYLEAFWHGDIVIYNGHSHFGNGSLEPQLYKGENFPVRYQILFINGCLSYNYYNRDFFEMKPGGSSNVDVVVNGLPSYVYGGGIASANFLMGLLNSTPKSYKQILKDMQIDLPWGVKGYDPMRVVDGELDNLYTPEATPLAVTLP